MKVRPLSEIAVAAAREVLANAGVRHPRDINVPAIAEREGALVLYGPMHTARASIVRTERHAIIWVDQRTERLPSALFPAAHELGHHKLHALIDHFAQCAGEAETGKRSGTAWRIEREADDFASELLIPAFLAATFCTAALPTLDDVERLAFTFRTSFTSSAIRYVQLTKGPCAFVRSENGRVKWATESRTFPGAIVKGRALHTKSLASRVRGRRVGRGDEPREVPGAAWGGDGTFVEHAIPLGAEGGVLSWVTPADVLRASPETATATL